MSEKVVIEIAPTTGGSFDFLVDPESTIDFIKKCIAKKLKVSKEQICLLHRDRLLENSKKVKDYGLADGSRVALVPSIETGLVTQRPEQSVLEALEGLNESQVGDFLSGKSPLNLTMRLGDHVMLIQLQLSKGQQQALAKEKEKISESELRKESSSNSSEGNGSPTPSTSSAGSSSSLVEASRNLTNTLKKLSSHVTSPTDTKEGTQNSTQKVNRKSNRKSRTKSSDDPTVITNHMQHHGKGVYSGTFSGTLNPALQDGLGKPKKHVSTIVHILNDLLGGVQQEPSGSTSKRKSESTGENPLKKSKKDEAETRKQENEQLRLKMESLREQLRIRKNKLLNRTTVNSS